MTKNKPKHLVRNLILIFALLSLIILGFKVTDMQKQLDENEAISSQVEVLLTGGDKVAGFTCGVLNEQRAKEILSVKKVVMAFGQGPTDEVRSTKQPLNSIFWSDNCKYQDVANSNRYVELYIATFQTDEDARFAFPDFLQVVNDAEEISTKYGEQLLYDGGALYLLSGNRIIQVAANNGNPGDIKNFSQKVLEDLIQELL